MALVGPLPSGSCPTGRARVHDWGCSIDCNGTEDTLCLVGSDDALENTDGPRVLGEDTPGKLKSTKENLAARLQSMASGDVESHRV